MGINPTAVISRAGCKLCKVYATKEPKMQNLESGVQTVETKSSIESDSSDKMTAKNPYAKNFYSFTLEDLEKFLKQYGKEKFRAQQIFKWVYEQRVTDFDQM